MVPPDNLKPGAGGASSDSAGVRRGRPSMRGSTRLSPRNFSIPSPTAAPTNTAQPATPSGPPRVRVLFVCVGNSCRSQMAEGFARVYGGDILEVHSAGLSPAAIVQPMTISTMAERNVRLDNQRPKGIEVMLRQSFDVIVNISGQRLPNMHGQVLNWSVPDPIGRNQDVYRSAAAQIEALVIRMILDIRAQVAKG